jgi:hypothetical protein
MDQGSLVIEQIDAGASFLAEFGKKAKVAAAFWMKASEEESWYLYIASDEFHVKNLDVAYGEVLRIAGQMKNPYFDPFQVKLIKETHPLAKAAIEILQRFPGRMAIRLHGRTFGGMGIDEVYIYPMPVTVQSLVV